MSDTVGYIVGLVMLDFGIVAVYRGYILIGLILVNLGISVGRREWHEV